MYRLAYNRNIVASDPTWQATTDQFTRNYQQAVAAETHTISPRTVGDFRAGYVLAVLVRFPQSSAADVNALGYPSIIPRIHLPQNAIQDFTTIGGQQVVDAGEATISASETITHVRGKHTLKFGGEVRAIRRNRFQYGGLDGNFNFNRDLTGNPQTPAGTGYGVATFLLGAMNAGSLTVGAKRHEEAKYYATFLQDDWRVNRKLMLNLGLRYEVQTTRSTSSTKSRISISRVSIRSPKCPACWNTRA